MPAIQPARLRQQAALLTQHFDHPEAFVRNLQYLLEFYAERIRRHSQKGKPGPMLPAYQVPQPVLRLLHQELIPLAQENPAAAFELCDALWGQPYLEYRMLACLLLGSISLDSPQPALERLRRWIQDQPENILLDALFGNGLEALRQQHPQVVLDLAESWIHGSQPLEKQLGLRVLASLIQQPGFENLPVLFRLIHPLCLNSPAVIRPDLLDLLETLARQSPQESAHFLRQTLQLHESHLTPWLVRQVLPAFPPAIQANLRQALRSQEASN